MAQDINKFIEKLTNASKDMGKLKNDNVLIDAINTLMNLSDEAGGFGGEVARVVPSNLHVYSESLTGLYKSLKTAAENAESGINQLIDYLDSMPIGSIRKKQFGTSSDTKDEPSTEVPTPSVDLTPNTDGGPKSAVVQNESLEEPASLSDFYHRDFNFKGQVFNESKETSPFNFAEISNDLDNSGKTFDFGALNSIQGRYERINESERFEEEEDTSVGEQVTGLKKRILERKGVESKPSKLDFNQLKLNTPDLDLGRMTESYGNDDIIGGAHVIDTPENSSSKSFSYSESKVGGSPSGVNVDLSDIELNIVEE